MFEKAKIRIACNELGIERRTAEFYEALHTCERMGLTTEESFEGAVSSDFDTMNRVTRIVGKVAAKKNYQQFDNLKRMILDAEYRHEHFQAWTQEVKPRAEEKGLWDVITTCGGYLGR
jgi:hypothetical protein